MTTCLWAALKVSLFSATAQLRLSDEVCRRQGHHKQQSVDLGRFTYHRKLQQLRQAALGRVWEAAAAPRRSIFPSFLPSFHPRTCVRLPLEWSWSTDFREACPDTTRQQERSAVGCPTWRHRPLCPEPETCAVSAHAEAPNESRVLGWTCCHEQFEGPKSLDNIVFFNSFQGWKSIEVFQYEPEIPYNIFLNTFTGFKNRYNILESTT